MSQQGMLMGDGAGNPVGNDAMSTSRESVNQHLARQPSGEGLGVGIVPQDQGPPVASNQWLVVAQGQLPVSLQAADSVPDNKALVGPIPGPQFADSELVRNQGYPGGLQGPPVAEGGQV